MLNLWEGSFTTPIARARSAAVLGTLARVLKEMDPKARYEVVRADVLSFDYCLSDRTFLHSTCPGSPPVKQ